jgi:hypothetical protein
MTSKHKLSHAEYFTDYRASKDLADIYRLRRSIETSLAYPELKDWATTLVDPNNGLLTILMTCIINKNIIGIKDTLYEIYIYDYETYNELPKTKTLRNFF